LYHSTLGSRVIKKKKKKKKVLGVWIEGVGVKAQGHLGPEP